MDLPAPFGPMTALISPSATRSETSSTAVRPPKRRVRPSAVEQHQAPLPFRGARPTAVRRPPRRLDRARDAREPAGREDHDEDEHEPVDVGLPVLDDARRCWRGRPGQHRVGELEQREQRRARATAPPSEPMPPRTTIATSSTDVMSPNVDGEMKPTKWA